MWCYGYYKEPEVILRKTHNHDIFEYGADRFG